MTNPAFPSCPTCTRPVDAPWRHRNAAGVLSEGCVDPCHDGQGAEPFPPRREDEPCLAGTPGCSSDHRPGGRRGCETY